MRALTLLVIVLLGLGGCASPAKNDGPAKTGTVVLDFYINEKGATEYVRVVFSTSSEFDEPAIQTVLKWRFKPPVKDGKPARLHAQKTIEFKLEDVPGAIKQRAARP